MNVLHLATFDAHGGAGVAALRLVDSLRRRGHDARLLVRDKTTEHRHVEAFGGNGASTPRPLTDPATHQLAWLFSQHARAPRTTLPFSSDLPTYDLAAHAAVRAADVLHLHWVTGFVSAFEIRQLQDLGKPVIWTLHDQFPFTGGCHYAARCGGFMRACTRCPLLAAEARPLATLTLAQKRGFIDPKRLLIVAPSRWIATSARQSALFRRARIEVVPYGIDVRARRAVTRDAARAALQIPADAIVIMTASLDRRDPRKGHAHFEDALRLVYSKLAPRVRGLRERLVVLTAGAGDASNGDGAARGIPHRPLGALGADDPRLIMAFRAADIFALTSLEDNLPNTLLEAMAAGAAVVAYNVGGIPDLLHDDANGRVVTRGNVKALAAAITELAADDSLRLRLGDAAAVTAHNALDWPIQAEAYERLYTAELARRRRRPAAAGRRSVTVAFRKNPYADAPKVKSLLTDRRAARLLTGLLRRHIDELANVIDARGGEIVALRDELARLSNTQATDREINAEELAGAEAEVTRLQRVIAARGGEIRELKKTLGDAQQAGARRKEVLSHLMRAQSGGHRGARRLSIGIFGVGESGRRVLEAAVLLDCNLVWLADNNEDLHGHTDLGCAVMRPEAVTGMSFDAAIIASAHRDAIRQQLLRLGVDPERIVAPDVTKTDAELFDELRRLLEPRRHATAHPHSARSSAGRS